MEVRALSGGPHHALYGLRSRYGLVKRDRGLDSPVLGLRARDLYVSGSGKTEQRTAFNKQIKEKHEAQIAAILTPPPVAPSAAVDSQPTAQGFAVFAGRPAK